MYQYKAKITRILGKIINKDGQCANDIMCQEGHAVPYHGQSKEDIAAEHIKNRQIVNSSMDDSENFPYA